MTQWPRSMHIALWSYALSYEVYFYNTLPILEDKLTRLEKFEKMDVGFNLHHLHTFKNTTCALIVL